MPTYCYTCPTCGATTEKVRGMEEAHPRTVRCECGQRAERDFAAEQTGTDNRVWERTLWSEGLAVHPEQVPEAIAFNKRMGVPFTEYDADGRPGFRSRGHRRAYGKAWQAFDGDAGYSDPQPRN